MKWFGQNLLDNLYFKKIQTIQIFCQIIWFCDLAENCYKNWSFTFKKDSRDYKFSVKSSDIVIWRKIVGKFGFQKIPKQHFKFSVKMNDVVIWRKIVE